MRNAIKEYIEYSSQEKKDLWNTATFVFDTNVFLNLYRYSNKTRGQLIEALDRLKPRIWMPYQVAFEFCKDRYEIINEANSRFGKIETDAVKLVDNWRKELRIEGNDSDFDELNKYLKDWITKKKDSNYLIFDVANDEVFNKVLDLFDGKAGKAYSTEEIQNIEQEGAKRYSEKTPPGYKDNGKPDNRYGDLFIWKEMLGYAKKQSVDIIFVTHDQKEDWWNISSGKTIGPRVELRKAFYEETGQKFHMYTMTSFLSFFTEDKDNTIDKATIDEVETLSSVTEKTVFHAQLEEYFESLGNEKEREILALSTRIENLEIKNAKRTNSIKTLKNKAKKGTLSAQEELALKRNKQNLKAGQKQIAQLSERLSSLMIVE